MARHYGIARVATAFALAAGLAWATPLAARAATVTGYDAYFDSEETVDASAVPVLTVQGSKDETIYLRVSEGSNVVADHLAYPLSEAKDAPEGEGTYVVTLDIEDYAYSKTYQVQAFADYAQTKQLFSGTLRGVYAQMGSRSVCLGVRTTADGADAAAYVAPETYTVDGITYSLNASQEPTAGEDGSMSYAYTATDKTATHDGKITYVTDDGTQVKVEKIEGLVADAEPRLVQIPLVIKGDDGNFYCTINAKSSVAASYPGKSEFVFHVMPVAEDVSEDAAGREARIELRAGSATGELLATDRVPVSQVYLYTPPSTLSLGSGQSVREFALDAQATKAATAGFDADRGYLELDPQAVEGTQTYVIIYDEQSTPGQTTYHITAINGLTGKVIETSDPITVAEGQPQTVSYGKRDDLGEGTFVPVGADATGTLSLDLSYESAGSRNLNVYYVPENYQPNEDYKITVNYVNVADRSVIKTKTYDVSHTMVSDLNISTPETFSEGGVDYVRLAGQEEGIQHGYYTYSANVTKGCTYTVYYRDVNDNLHQSTVVTRIHVTYLPGQTIYLPGTETERDSGTRDNGTTDTGTTSTGATGATGTGTAGRAIGITDGGDLSTVNDGTDSAVVDGAGNDTNAVRINDNETPLAQGKKNQQGLGLVSAVAQNPGMGIGIAAGAALLALLLFVVLKRRRKDKDATEAPKSGEGR